MTEAKQLPELDEKQTRAAVEAHFETYRLYKYLDYEEREPVLTASYESRDGGQTNVTSDPTANIAASNVDEGTRRRDYCTKVETAVARLPDKEQQLIRKRYMVDDYVLDRDVYKKLGVGKDTFREIRRRAFEKLARKLGIGVLKQNEKHKPDEGEIQ